MKHYLELYFKCIDIIIFLGFFLFCHALNAQTPDSLLASYDNYTKLPREVAYLHLNKSTYLKGEQLGLAAYIMDKGTKKPSNLTTNLYCTIEDATGKTIKSKLIRAQSGHAANLFEIDSTFSSGHYTIKAYTNWMRNFDEPNAFVEKFRVINPKRRNKVDEKEPTQNNIDAQFLPEGGHLLLDAPNIIGLAIKCFNGLGVAGIKGEVIDSEGSRITNFETNKMGISRFLLHPRYGQRYSVNIEHNEKTMTFPIKNIESKGFNLALTDLGAQVAVRFSTNPETLEQIRGITYHLAIHDGSTMKVTDFSFDQLSVTKLIDKKDLKPGINIFTVFDSKSNPILERLYFSPNGISRVKIGNAAVEKGDKDSLSFKMSVKGFDAALLHNLSISVLPSRTRSYKRHHNILSHLLLRPYLKSDVENAAGYFRDMGRKALFELDNLLITQGWSAYGWDDIFNRPPKNIHAFETGIGIKANVNHKNAGQFMVYGLSSGTGDMVSIGESEKSFVKAGLLPEGDEQIKISEIGKDGKMRSPNIYLQFSPSKITGYGPHTLSMMLPISKALIQL